MPNTTRRPNIFPAWRFFKANAGYATPPGLAACALSLARAEAWLKSQPNLVVVWLDDPDADLSFMEPAERAQDHTAEGCIIYRACPDHGVDCKHADHLTSLWSIIDASDDYRRVVVAELASEIME